MLPFRQTEDISRYNHFLGSQKQKLKRSNSRSSSLFRWWCTPPLEWREAPDTTPVFCYCLFLFLCDCVCIIIFQLIKFLEKKGNLTFKKAQTKESACLPSSLSLSLSRVWLGPLQLQTLQGKETRGSFHGCSCCCCFPAEGMVSLVRTSSRMRWGMPQIDHGDGRILSHSHRQLVSSLPVAPYSSSSSPSFIDNLQKDSLPLQSSQVAPPPPPPPPSSGSSKISPAVLFIIVILAVIFFISGLLHLLVRFLIKQSPASPQSSGRHTREIPGSDALQRQLQQLFHLHDSGLDQAFIDALPVFLYKEIVGAKEPFDCAVCLCEFADEDKLRLLPVCSHAFHLNCIDTWLLSNSTCPLCRGTLFVPGLAIENPVFDLEDLRDEEGLPGDREDGFSAAGPKPVEVEEGTLTEKRVFPVRLGKFRSVNNEEDACGPVVDVDVPTNNVKREEGESSSSSLDARRCYSMGSFQYVVGNFNLQVSLSNDRRRDGADFKDSRRRELTVNCAAAAAAMDDRANGKRLWAGSRGESFSVSKIWQWSSKKGKFPVCSDTASLDGGLPWLRTSGGDS